jgi:carboxyl-terminal processing protease
VLSTLDPHTNLLEPDDFEDMKASTQGSFGGLGIEIKPVDGAITIVRVIEGNPAAKAGLQVGDRIVQIDRQSAVTMPSGEAVTLLRGPAGTTVSVWVTREGFDKARRYDITRATITLDSVVGDVVRFKDASGRERRVGIVEIPRSFAQTTGQELRTKLEEMQRQKVEGIVLDLRGNPGGLLGAAVEVADAFLSSGTIVATVGRAPDREENSADDRWDFPDLPLVVLANEHSASASEIVAGALRELGRAVVVGRRTFGKGSVQVLQDRRAAGKEVALKLTIAQYLVGGRVSVQSAGVTPDVELLPVNVGKEFVHFFARKFFDMSHEDFVPGHLEGEGAEQAQGRGARPGSAYGPVYYLDPDSLGYDGTGPARPGMDDRSKVVLEDPEVRIAAELVAWAPASRRDTLLDKLGPFVSGVGLAEEGRIVGSLANRSIAWKPGPPPADGKRARLRITVTTDPPGGVVRAGQTAKITVTVHNDGDTPAYQVRAISDSDNGELDERELLFGRVEPGAAVSQTLAIPLGEHALSRTDRIAFRFFEQHGARLVADSRTSVDLVAEGLPRPNLGFGWQIVDDPRYGKQIVGNGDGRLQSGERVLLHLDAHNLGEGPSLDTWITVRAKGEDVFIHNGHAKIGSLPVGAAKPAPLDVELRGAPSDGVAKLRISVSDTKTGEQLVETLAIPVAASSPAVAAARGTYQATTEVLLSAAPEDGARPVASLAPGGRVVATGATPGWLRVDLGDDSFAFAREASLTPAKGGGKPTGVTRLLEVSPPRIELSGNVSRTDATSVHVAGVATDSEAVRDIFITVINLRDERGRGPQKVFYQATSQPKAGRLEFAADVPLLPGNNLIEIRARQNDDVVGVRRLFVMRTTGLEEARAKDAARLRSQGTESTPER